METLSGLTPALSRRLQRQLLARLPPAAARTLRRTLSANCPSPSDVTRPRRDFTRSVSAAQSADRASEVTTSLKRDSSDVSLCTENQIESNILPVDESKLTSDTKSTEDNSVSVTSLSKRPEIKSTYDNSDADLISIDKSFNSFDLRTEKSISTSGGGSITPRRASSVRSTPDRSVLSKYFSPERTPLGDRPYLGNGTEAGGISVEPNYLAAYGGANDVSGGLLRRRSLRTPPAEAPIRRRVSRFLRPDFFDTPREESVYVRDKKDRELETQKILKEIREKKSRVVDPSESVRSRSASFARLSPVDSLASGDVSRSVTPFFLALDDIHETHDDANSRTELQRALMAIGKRLDESNSIHSDDGEKSKRNGTFEMETLNTNSNTVPEKESRIARPKSFPTKPSEGLTVFKDFENNNSNICPQSNTHDNDTSERESKLIRPKSYPASTPEKTANGISINTLQPKKPTNQKHSISTVENHLALSDTCNINNNASPVKDDNGNITVTFSINLPKKTVKPPVHEENVVENIIKIEEKKKSSPKKKKIIVKKKSAASKTIVPPTDNSDKAIKEDVNPDKAQAESGPTKIEESKLSPARKKSVLSSIGEKFEKFRIDGFNKSSSQEKESISVSDKLVKQPASAEAKEEKAKVSRIENVMRVLRERSVPTGDRSESITESGLIKRAVTITDLPTLEIKDSHSKKGVNRVLGLFKKIESKDKLSKPDVLNTAIDKEAVEPIIEVDNVELASKPSTVISDLTLADNKPKRPTSLLLNGIGKRVQACYSGAASDSILNKTEKKSAKADESTDSSQGKVDDNKTQKKGLRLDFSRLPRLNQGIFNKRNSLETSKSREGSMCKESTENQDMDDKQKECHDASSEVAHENGTENCKQDFANVPLISPNWSPDCDTSKFMVEPSDTPVSPGGTQHPQRTHEGTSPDPENIVDRIRRKSFYSRFNEKKNRRKSLLVGPGAKEYIPSARIHPHSDADASSYSKYDSSPTSPLKYATSPLASEHARSFQPLDKIDCLSPSTSRLRSIVNDSLSSGCNKSLERYENRYLPETKYSETASHYSIPRYNRTVSLFDNFELKPGTESKVGSSRYGRTLSQLSPGNYATYSPRTHSRNSAILLRENGEDMESSRDSILAKIRSRKSPATLDTARDDDAILDSKLRSNSSQPSEHDLPVDKTE